MRCRAGLPSDDAQSVDDTPDAIDVAGAPQRAAHVIDAVHGTGQIHDSPRNRDHDSGGIESVVCRERLFDSVLQHLVGAPRNLVLGYR